MADEQLSSEEWSAIYGVMSKELANFVDYVNDPMMEGQGWLPVAQQEVERLQPVVDRVHAIMIDQAMRGDDELSDIEKVNGLRALVLVELIGAHQMKPDDDGRVSDYVLGRVNGYELVLDAIGRRWPELQHWQAEVERFFEEESGRPDSDRRSPRPERGALPS